MRKLPFLIVASLTLAGCAGVKKGLYKVDEAAAASQSLYPLEPGRTWIYKGRAMKILPVLVVMRVADVVDIDGVPVAVIASRSKHPFATSDTTLYMANAEKGPVLYRMDVNAKVGGAAGLAVGAAAAYNPPKPLGPQGNAQGGKWEHDYTEVTGLDPLGAYVNKFGDWGNAILGALVEKAPGPDKPQSKKSKERFEHMGTETISTGLGKFETVKVRTAMVGTEQHRLDYFAPGVGIVRIETYFDSKPESPLFRMDLVSTFPDEGDKLFYPGKFLGVLPRKPHDYKAKVEKVKEVARRLASR